MPPNVPWRYALVQSLDTQDSQPGDAVYVSWSGQPSFAPGKRVPTTWNRVLNPGQFGIFDKGQVDASELFALPIVNWSGLIEIDDQPITDAIVSAGAVSVAPNPTQTASPSSFALGSSFTFTPKATTVSLIVHINNNSVAYVLITGLDSGNNYYFGPVATGGPVGPYIVQDVFGNLEPTAGIQVEFFTSAFGAVSSAGTYFELAERPADNIPQLVAGNVAVTNLPATQPISGAVSVSNFPASQTVNGAVSLQPITGTMLSQTFNVSLANGATSTIVAGVSSKTITVYGFTLGVSVGAAELVNATLQDTTAATNFGFVFVDLATAAGAVGSPASLSIPQGLKLPLSSGIRVLAGAGAANVICWGSVLYTGPS